MTKRALGLLPLVSLIVVASFSEMGCQKSKFVGWSGLKRGGGDDQERGVAVVLSSTSPDPVSEIPIPVKAKFTEEVLGFEAKDVVVTNGALKDFAGSGAEYTFNITPQALGLVKVEVPADVASNKQGKKNRAADPLTRNVIALSLDLNHELKTSLTGNSIWVVTDNGNAFRIVLDKERGYPMQQWSGLGGGGHRTYVSEIGLIVGTTGDGIYRVADDVPEAGKAQKIWDMPSKNYFAWDNSKYQPRICATSFVVNGVAYIGAAYVEAEPGLPDGTGRPMRKFVKIPIDKTKPGKIDVSKAKIVSFDGYDRLWGYSCFVDKDRHLFWSQWSSPRGVDLITDTEIDVSKAPNGAQKFTVQNVSNFDLTQGGSYAMSGDSYGNLLAVQSHGSFPNLPYTAAHDPVSKSVLQSIYMYVPYYENNVLKTYNMLSAPILNVFDETCFQAGKPCAQGNVATYNLAAKDPSLAHSFIGPMSSLNDGRVVGVTRPVFGDANPKAEVFLLSVSKDAATGAKTLNAEKIKELSGHAYMYSDFTGATLYAVAGSYKFDLKTIKGFNPKKKIDSPRLKWTSESGGGQAWVGLKFSVRCSLSTNAAKADFTDLTASMPAADGEIALDSVPSCKGPGAYDEVEIKVDPTGGVFSKTSTFEFLGSQNMLGPDI